MYKYLLITFLVFFSHLSANNDYITGDDGVVRIYVNVIGHVNQPGSYLVPDGSDLLTVLSLAGGPARGANLKNIKISNGNIYTVDFNDLINNNLSTNIIITPNTSIFVNETYTSKLFRGSNLVSSLLQLLNIAITLERTN
mgnify:CR=1 FL=1|tara:strand:- start:370 stop:789 length:420 start_codon:yes stop_codon:yes gene_type:complete